ncbi:MAG: AAA family ATPase [Candidatus Pacebacteria bacterium]|nr:AAA family ATPase [Candidatus Paceibacterota bacterium]
MAAKLCGQNLKDAVKVYNEMFADLKRCFVGRDHVVDVLRYAVAQCQHVLIFGDPGTAKTAIFDVFFSGIEGANGFHVELNMFMTADELFGPLNPKKMREEGVLEHNIEGMLPQANLARLGEFLDANMPLLRSTLSALNERRFIRGKQAVNIPLITAYCDTNTPPGVFLAKNPQAWAVFDRFLFITEAPYLDNAGDLGEMIRRFQMAEVGKLKSKISLSLIREISRLIVEPPSLFTNPAFFLSMGEALCEYRQKRRGLIANKRILQIMPDISDRRICWATQMAEAHAVLDDARTEIFPEDILHLHYALGTTEDEKALWLSIAERYVEKIKETMKLQLSDLQYAALEGFVKEMEQLVPASCNNPEALRQSNKRAGEISRQIAAIVPEKPEVDAFKQKAKQTAVDVLKDIQKKMQEYLNG